ncbi:NAD+ synthase [soil metagenome]
MSTIGYPPKDLLLKKSLIQENLDALDLIAAESRGIDVVVGYAEPNPQPVGRALFNCAALLRDGRMASRYRKVLLPTYDVFDEGRYFEPGGNVQEGGLLSLNGCTLGLSVCEDAWNDDQLLQRMLYPRNPITELCELGVDVLLNISASPFTESKHQFRREMFAAQARRCGRPLVLVNQVGANDELVFDGNSLVLDKDGRVVAHAKGFEEDLLIADLDTLSGRCEPPVEGVAAVHDALVLGLRDYVRKCGFHTVVLGLSGGIDSALVAALAVEALGADRVFGVALPSRYSSEHSVADARALADNLGIAFQIIPIEEVHSSFEHTLAPLFAGHSSDVTEENLQARTRGVLLMALSNKFNHLLLTTGNKSELAVGYATLYGDMCGGLAVISDVPKTTVYELCRWMNTRAGRAVIPESTLTKPPSAELRPDQVDQDSLPPYDILDEILERYIESDQGASEIIQAGFEPEVVRRVIRLVDRSEYKRRQAPPGLKVTGRAFGSGRRMPIAQGYEEVHFRHGEPAVTPGA